jgi:2-aminobenzoate-CoA ligase
LLGILERVRNIGMRDQVLMRTRVPKDYWPPADAWPSIRPTSFVDWTEEFSLAAYLLERNLELRPEQAALFFGEQSLTYRELSRGSTRLGSSLKKLGVRSGDRVALRMSNRPEFIIADMALQKIGAIGVPLFALLKAPSIAHILRDAQITLILAEAGLMEEVEKAGLESVDHVVVYGETDARGQKKGYHRWERLFDEGNENLQSETIYYHDVAMIHYTSGTTGAAKGCIQTPVGILGHVAGTVHRAGLREGDVLAVSPPLPFAYGHAAVMYAFYIGGAAILVERFNVEEYLAQAARHRATVLVGVPTLYRMMLPEMAKYDLSSVRLVMTAGETFTGELEQSLREALPQANFFNFYGYTEMWNFIGTVPGTHAPRSLGIPYEEYEVRIVNEETGQPVGVGEVGAIEASGAAGALYWRLPERQRAVVKNGMFYSGDLAYRDEQGVIWFKARDVDIIKSSGYLIAPYEIEDVLNRHAAVAMVGCIGVSDPVKGEIIKAFVKLKTGFRPSDGLIADLESFAGEKLEKYKVPRAWQFIEEMPVTSSGKTMRRGLKELEMKRKGAAG